MASLPSRVMASLSPVTPDAPRPVTGVRDLPDPGPNHEEPAEGLDTVESTTARVRRTRVSAAAKYVGWDWTSRGHDVTVLDGDGALIDRWAFSHTESG